MAVSEDDRSANCRQAVDRQSLRIVPPVTQIHFILLLFNHDEPQALPDLYIHPQADTTVCSDQWRISCCLPTWQTHSNSGDSLEEPLSP